MFPSLRAQGNVMSNYVSATMCPRLPVALGTAFKQFARCFLEKTFLGCLWVCSEFPPEKPETRDA